MLQTKCLLNFPIVSVTPFSMPRLWRLCLTAFCNKHTCPVYIVIVHGVWRCDFSLKILLHLLNNVSQSFDQLNEKLGRLSRRDCLKVCAVLSISLLLLERDQGGGGIQPVSRPSFRTGNTLMDAVRQDNV